MQSESPLVALRRRWPLIVALAVIGLALGIAFAPTTTKVSSGAPLDLSAGGYTASATVGIPPSATAQPNASYPTKLALFYSAASVVGQRTANLLGWNVPPAAIRSALTIQPAAGQGGPVRITGRARTAADAVALVNTFTGVETRYLNHVSAVSHQKAVTAAKKRVDSLRGQLKRLSQRAQSLTGQTGSSSQLQLVQLQHQRTALEDAYQSAYQAFATVSADPSPSNFLVVLQPATANSTSPVAVSKLKHGPLVGVIGLLVGAALGIALALVLAQTDRRLRTRSQVEAWFRSPVLVEIPRQRLRGDSRDVVVATDPTSPTAEAYRVLRTVIMVADPTRPGRPVVSDAPAMGGGSNGDASGSELVTLPASRSSLTALRGGFSGRGLTRHGSPRPLDAGHVIVVTAAADEGIRPTVVANLAVAFAEIGIDALIVRTAVDQDGAAPDPGQPVVTDVRRAIRASAVDAVHTLDLGRLGPSRRPIADVIAEVSDFASVILVEAAPILDAHDVGVLNTVADDVLVVAEYGHTTSDAAARSAALLGRMGTVPRGIVLAQVPHKRSATAEPPTEPAIALPAVGSRSS